MCRYPGRISFMSCPLATLYYHRHVKSIQDAIRDKKQRFTFMGEEDHYDWGLRAIKSVLVVAGSLKRGDSGRAEDQVLMRALRDFNIPKIVTDDMPEVNNGARILYINPADLGWNPPVSSWIDKREVQSEKANLTILFDKYLPSCLDVLRSR
ncbi:hypothetical protein F7725_021386 [Dissostichus mawsoni]|uniref:Dynein heavy chain hydrolytic ATP-binding dynein motor region domain-containing protein n=1 Tax=Dissostichus mawsoni TaxID=36200 RepID=A0A7J5ZE28_DISMA|nr:hypothetical protein F7725_021386 [Dissostichus mawsoni]